MLGAPFRAPGGDFEASTMRGRRAPEREDQFRTSGAVADPERRSTPAEGRPGFVDRRHCPQRLDQGGLGDRLVDEVTQSATCVRFRALEHYMVPVLEVGRFPFACLALMPTSGVHNPGFDAEQASHRRVHGPAPAHRTQPSRPRTDVVRAGAQPLPAHLAEANAFRRLPLLPQPPPPACSPRGRGGGRTPPTRSTPAGHSPYAKLADRRPRHPMPSSRGPPRSGSNVVAHAVTVSGGCPES